MNKFDFNKFFETKGVESEKDRREILRLANEIWEKSGLIDEPIDNKNIDLATSLFTELFRVK